MGRTRVGTCVVVWTGDKKPVCSLALPVARLETHRSAYEACGRAISYYTLVTKCWIDSLTRKT